MANAWGKAARMGICYVVVLLSVSSATSHASGQFVLTSAASGEGFKLTVLTGRWDSLALGSERAESWAVLSKIDLSKNLLTFTTADVAAFGWSQQTIFLTADASDRLMAAMRGGKVPFNLWYQAFVVSLDSKRLYGGIFYDRPFESGIGYPVIYTDFDYLKWDVLDYPSWDSGFTFSFTIRPIHNRGPYDDFAPSFKAEIEFPELRDYFAQQGKLTY